MYHLVQNSRVAKAWSILRDDTKPVSCHKLTVKCRTHSQCQELNPTAKRAEILVFHHRPNLATISSTNRRNSFYRYKTKRKVAAGFLDPINELSRKTQESMWKMLSTIFRRLYDGCFNNFFALQWNLFFFFFSLDRARKFFFFFLSFLFFESPV